ncbi:hypothetical protein [Haloarchaeobius sp. DFWS5]|uniref:hypothetical protein n=1 Tax=Haloarchaeobius sp. DFWS5 TaxID=3446114 RepID=UPI003EBE7B37
MTVEDKTKTLTFSADGSGKRVLDSRTVPLDEIWYVDSVKLSSMGDSGTNAQAFAGIAIINEPSLPLTTSDKYGLATTTGKYSDNGVGISTSAIGAYAHSGEEIAIVGDDGGTDAGIDFHATVTIRRVC